MSPTEPFDFDNHPGPRPEEVDLILPPADKSPLTRGLGQPVGADLLKQPVFELAHPAPFP
jgi:hypothetical protein